MAKTRHKKITAHHKKKAAGNKFDNIINYYESRGLSADQAIAIAAGAVKHHTTWGGTARGGHSTASNISHRGGRTRLP